MTHDATLVFTEQLLRKAVFAFWRRSVGFGFIAALVAAALSLCLLLMQGDKSWVVGVLAAALLFGGAFAVALYFLQYRGAMRKFHAMSSPQATFRAEPSSFTIVSRTGSVTLEWSAIKELWQFPEVWLLLYSPAQFNTLPLACLSPEMQAYVVQHVRSAGGKIVT